MAKIKNGNISGLIGGIVGYTMNGENIIRTAPKKRSNWTDRQLSNRLRFSKLSSFWRQFKYTPVGQIWKVADEKRRANNLFVQANSAAFGFEGEIIDPQFLHFSAGRLPLPHKFAAKPVEGESGKVEVSWMDDPKRWLSRPDDELMMMIANGDKFDGPIATGFIRKKEKAVIELPAEMADIKGIYLFFGSEKRKLYSPDAYFEVRSE